MLTFNFSRPVAFDVQATGVSFSLAVRVTTTSGQDTESPTIAVSFLLRTVVRCGRVSGRSPCNAGVVSERAIVEPDRMEQLLRNIDRRVERIEQILPTLATRAELEPLATRVELQAAIEPLAPRAELQAAIEPLATRAELQAAIEPLATRTELQAAIEPLATRTELRAAISEAEQRIRTYFDVVAESLRDDIQLIAAALASLSQREG